MTEYILLKDLSKIARVHKSLEEHSNRIYQAQATEETETKKIEYLANGILWSENTVKEKLSREDVFHRYPEYLL